MTLFSTAKTFFIRTACALAMVLVSSAASAQDGCPPVAGKSIKELVDEGKASAREGEYACARELLRSAYAKQESFDVAGNLGIVTHELAKEQGDPSLYAESATLLTAALRGFPVGGPEEQRTALEERAADSRAKVVSLTVELSPASACLVISKRDAGCGPFPYDVFAPPGTVVVSAKAPGYQSTEKTFEAAGAGTSLKVAIDLTAAVKTAPASPGDPPPPSGGDSASSDGVPLWPTFVAGGLALALVGIGVGLFVVGDGEKSDAVALGDETAREVGNPNFCAPPIQSNVQSECTTIADLLASHDTFKEASTGMFVTGGVMVFVAGALLVTHLMSDDGSPDSAALSVAPTFDVRGGVGITAQGRF